MFIWLFTYNESEVHNPEMFKREKFKKRFLDILENIII